MFNEGANMRNMIGQQVVNQYGLIIGTITDQYNEGHKTWAVIDDGYEVCLNGCEEVIDLMGVERAKNPCLKSSFVRLSATA
jgi:hypothetical protein